ncbi:MAG: nicotinamide-nucleotide amidohydrolase family protein [Chloroflexi bacterium]|nr:nicotinamide-nucleotide amidohydrolase family protein [Chloroflexota bacterium]
MNTTPLLEQYVGERLRVNGMTLALAESCTGGLVAKRLTDVPGSSNYLIGGMVAYDNTVKCQFLGVREETLTEHGAVSETVAQQMARGARVMFGTDLAVSITGIAGPGGGSADKPIGLTFVGLNALTGTWVRRFEFAGSRAEVRQAASDAALQIVLDYLDGNL